LSIFFFLFFFFNSLVYRLAILANKDTLFIVNGIDAISKVTSLPIVLNISNPSSITYVQKYTDPNVSLESSRDQPYEYDSSEGLSTGAVAGISVGAAIVVSDKLAIETV
jgi:hypothetical protein